MNPQDTQKVPGCWLVESHSVSPLEEKRQGNGEMGAQRLGSQRGGCVQVLGWTEAEAPGQQHQNHPALEAEVSLNPGAVLGHAGIDTRTVGQGTALAPAHHTYQDPVPRLQAAQGSPGVALAGILVAPEVASTEVPWQHYALRLRNAGAHVVEAVTGS